MRIKLDSGKEVKVSDFCFGYVYEGMLCGIPDEKSNRSIFDKITIPTNWGEDRNVLKIEPTQSEFENRLKPVFYIAWLDSHIPINPKFHGSSLIVIWLGDEPGNRSIEDIVKNGTKDIDWNKYAKDYEY